MKQYEPFPGVDLLLLIATIVMADTYIANHTATMDIYTALTILGMQTLLKLSILGFLVYEYLRLGAKEYLIALPLAAYAFCLTTHI